MDTWDENDYKYMKSNEKLDTFKFYKSISQACTTTVCARAYYLHNFLANYPKPLCSFCKQLSQNFEYF